MRTRLGIIICFASSIAVTVTEPSSLPDNNNEDNNVQVFDVDSCPLLLTLPLSKGEEQDSNSLLDYLYCGGTYNEFVEEEREGGCISRHNFGEEVYAAIMAIQDVHYNFESYYFYLFDTNRQAFGTYADSYSHIIGGVYNNETYAVRHRHCIEYQSHNQSFTPCKTETQLSASCGILSTTSQIKSLTNYYKSISTDIPTLFLNSYDDRSAISMDIDALVSSTDPKNCKQSNCLLNAALCTSTASASAKSFLRYIRHIRRKNDVGNSNSNEYFIVILYDNAPYNYEFQRELKRLANKYNEDGHEKWHVLSYGYSSSIPRALSRALQKVKDSNFATILALVENMFQSELELFVESAEQIGLVNEDYLWILHDRYNSFTDDKVGEVNNLYDYSLSPFTSNFVRGLGLLVPSKPPSAFTERWREKRQFYRSDPYFCGISGDCIVNHTSSINHSAKPSSTVSNLAGYAYNAILSIYIGRNKCLQEQAVKESGASFIQCLHVGYILSSNVSDSLAGDLSYNITSRSVSNDGQDFQMFNFRPYTTNSSSIKNKSNQKDVHDRQRKEEELVIGDIYQVILTSTYENILGWNDQVDSPFIYWDLSNDPPKNPYFVSVNENYTPYASRVLGYVVAFAGSSFSLYSIFCIYLHRKHEELEWLKPTFLYVTCISSFGLFVAIAALLTDDGISGLTLDVMKGVCFARIFPIFIVGLTECLFFVKVTALKNQLLMDVEHVDMLQQQRSTNTIAYSLLSIFTAFIIWSAVESIHWSRRNVAKNEYGFTIESQGQCMPIGSKWEATIHILINIMCLTVIATFLFMRKSHDVLRGLSSENILIMKDFAKIYLCVCCDCFMIVSTYLAFYFGNSIPRLLTSKAAVYYRCGVSAILAWSRLYIIVYGKIKDMSPYKYQGRLDDDNCSIQAIAGIEEDIENDTKITLN